MTLMTIELSMTSVQIKGIKVLGWRVKYPYDIVPSLMLWALKDDILQMIIFKSISARNFCVLVHLRPIPTPAC